MKTTILHFPATRPKTQGSKFNMSWRISNIAWKPNSKTQNHKIQESGSLTRHWPNIPCPRDTAKELPSAWSMSFLFSSRLTFPFLMRISGSNANSCQKKPPSWEYELDVLRKQNFLIFTHFICVYFCLSVHSFLSRFSKTPFKSLSTSTTIEKHLKTFK